MKSSLSWPFPKNWTRLWPAMKGSLALVYKPCIRPGCPQCSQGTKHPAHILSFTQKGKRRCMYVPASLVAMLQKALKNGRRLEEVLYAQGPLFLQRYRQERSQKTSLKPTQLSLPARKQKNPRKSATIIQKPKK